MFIGTNPAPPDNPPDGNLAYLQDIPGRTMPIDADTIAAVNVINGLAVEALEILAGLVRGKALRDMALSAAAVNGSIIQAAATLTGAGLQSAATSAAASSSRQHWMAIINELEDIGTVIGSGAALSSTLSTINSRLLIASENNFNYAQNTGPSNINQEGGPTNPLDAADPGSADYVEPTFLPSNYYIARAKWHTANMRLFNNGKYINANWFDLIDVPAWTG